MNEQLRSLFKPLLAQVLRMQIAVQESCVMHTFSCRERSCAHAQM